MTIRRKIFVTSLLIGVAATSTGIAVASSHREAPGTAGQPKIDGTDFYMFRSYDPNRTGFVTFIANYLPLQAPYGGPNYFTLDHNAIYEIHVDTDGDAKADLTYQFKFSTALANNGNGITLSVGGKDIAIPLRQSGPIANPGDPTINETEAFTLTQIDGDPRSGLRTSIALASNAAVKSFVKPIDNIGTKTIPNYGAYAAKHIYDVTLPGCATPARVFVGQRADAFAVNLGEIFDLANLVPLQGVDNAAFPQYNVGAGAFPGGITQSHSNDEVLGKANVTSLALEVPIACVTGTGNGVIGAWTTASLPQAELRNPGPSYNATTAEGGAYVQVSRLSAPLVNELVIGLKDKDLFNAANPTQDGALADYVTNPTLPALLNILFKDAVNATLGTSFTNIAPTNFPRTDLVAAFLTGFPGLNQQKTVTGSEMMRLNTAIPPVAASAQSVFGVAGGDVAGFPNGRRPGDDTVDIALRVIMGRLCYDLPIGDKGAGVNLGYCKPSDAVVGNAAFTDGAPTSPTSLQSVFPYLNDPIPGSPAQ